jgi:hypothetical protein
VALLLPEIAQSRLPPQMPQKVPPTGRARLAASEVGHGDTGSVKPFFDPIPSTTSQLSCCPA